MYFASNRIYYFYFQENWSEDLSNHNFSDSTNQVVQGKRIIDFMYFYNQLQTIAVHNTKRKCDFSCIYPVSESKNGLCTDVSLKCSNCNMYFNLSLNDKADGSDLNFSAVSGAEITGLGYTGLKTLCDSVGVPSMTHSKYNQVHKQLDLYEQNQIFIEETEFDTSRIKQELIINDEIDDEVNNLLLQNNELEIIPIHQLLTDKNNGRNNNSSARRNRLDNFRNYDSGVTIEKMLPRPTQFNKNGLNFMNKTIVIEENTLDICIKEENPFS